MTEQIEQAEQVEETLSSCPETQEANALRATADDYAYFVKVLIDAGLRDSFAYAILEQFIKKS